MGVRRICAVTLLAAFLLIACSKDENPVVEVVDTPAAPEWAHVAATSDSAITLRWTDAADDAGFIIYRAAGSPNGLAPVDTTLPGVEEYYDADLSSRTNYYYRIRTRDALGRMSLEQDSPLLACETRNNRTPETPRGPYPLDRSFDQEFLGQVTLSWEGGDPDGDEITRVLYFADSRIELEQQVAASGIAADSLLLSQSLQLSRFYFWRVRFTDSYGATSLSPIWSFGTKIERIEVPAGYFFQGDSGVFHPDDPERFHCPFNPVSVPAFTMDKYEVTNQLYAQFLNELLEDKWIRVSNGEVRSKVLDTLFIRVFPDGAENSGIAFEEESGTAALFVPRSGRENHPVVELTWFGAQRFARRYHRRLPTEAEWEKAARGTANTRGTYHFVVGEQPDSVGLGLPYPWGSLSAANRFNYSGSGDPFESSVGIATAPVGYYDGSQRNGYATGSNGSPYGVFDLAGNVAEWCSSDFVPYQGGPYGQMKVVKGGGWRSPAHWCQTYWRQELAPESTDVLVGFRTVAAP